jgi:hypothetical protein
MFVNAKQSVRVVNAATRCGGEWQHKQEHVETCSSHKRNVEGQNMQSGATLRLMLSA